MTDTERQNIVDTVLRALRTNSKTIDQLTPVTSLSSSDCFEINGGRKVAYSVLSELLATMAENDRRDLQEAIDRKELHSVSIATTADTATLSISSTSKTINCSIPVATSLKSGIITAADKVKLDSAYSTANSALEQARRNKEALDAVTGKDTSEAIESLNEIIAFLEGLNDSEKLAERLVEMQRATTLAQGRADDAMNEAGAAQDTADMALRLAEDALEIKQFNYIISEEAEGFADVPAGAIYFDPTNGYFRRKGEHDTLPDYNAINRYGGQPYAPRDDRFFLMGTELYLGDWRNKQLVLLQQEARDAQGAADIAASAASNAQDTADRALELAGKGRVLPVDYIGSLTGQPWDGFADGTIGYNIETHQFEQKGSGGAPEGYNKPGHNGIQGSARADQLYKMGTGLYLYDPDTHSLVDVTSVAYAEAVAAMTKAREAEEAAERNRVAIVQAGRSIYDHRTGTGVFPFEQEVDTEEGLNELSISAIAYVRSLKAFRRGQNAAFNESDFYNDLSSEDEAARTARTDVLFRRGAELYRFNGSSLVKASGASAEGAAMVNVNRTCGDRDYTLSTALAALEAHESSTGDAYRKKGLVITYRTASSDALEEWETRQYTGIDLPSIYSEGVEGLWAAFGAEVSDTPEESGKEAFSTGGAYRMHRESFSHLDIDQDEENYLVSAVSRGGEQMGEAISIPKGGGGVGTVSGTTCNVWPQSTVAAGKLGESVTLRAAVRSVTYEGTVEQPNRITRIAITDADGAVLWERSFDARPSSSRHPDGTMEYDFEFDFTSLLPTAMSRQFYLRAWDDSGNSSRPKAVTAKAVDCTAVCTHQLGSTVAAGGGSVSFSLYQFPRNVSSGEGISVRTEIRVGGEWLLLGEAKVTDTYPHTVSVNPADVQGHTLGHGSYLMRVRGTDILTGVSSNVLYTTLLVVDSSSTEPLAAIQYNDTEGNATVRRYATLPVKFAAYTPGTGSTAVSLHFGESLVSAQTFAAGNSPCEAARQVDASMGADGDTLTLRAVAGGNAVEIPLTISGKAIEADMQGDVLWRLDFGGRDNSEPDHTMRSGGYELVPSGINWDSTGFTSHLGARCLRVAEDASAVMEGYTPFAAPAVEETSGMGFMAVLATKNVADPDTPLMEIAGAGGLCLRVYGNRAEVSLGADSASASFTCDRKVTVAVVVQPRTQAVTRAGGAYSHVMLYIDGEPAGALAYPATGDRRLSSGASLRMSSEAADLYVYSMTAFASWASDRQAFDNYLCSLPDTSEMLAEHEREDVLDASGRPDRDRLHALGIASYVVIPKPYPDGKDTRTPEQIFAEFDAGTDTGTNFLCDLIYTDPAAPWRSFRAYNVRWRRQGTTSAKRPVKNDRFYFRKESGWRVEPAYDTESAEIKGSPDYERYVASAALLRMGYVQVGDMTVPDSVVTVKVDYSDSSMANDCGVCDMMNATWRALGPAYMTPAQRGFDGTWSNGDVALTGLQLNHSTANHPVAAFRATSRTLSDLAFHARGNWKEDKGAQVALGFRDVSGYNKGCLNYGDFTEWYGAKGETLAEAEARFLAESGHDTSRVYLVSQYCGRDYAFYRFSGGAWVRSTGSMRQVDGQWRVEGDVLNPVTGYELLNYQDFDWWQVPYDPAGETLLDGFMRPVTSFSPWVAKLRAKEDSPLAGVATVPAWTQYFECMVDDDQLQLDLALGRKVPYDLYRVFEHLDRCDYAKRSAEEWKAVWRDETWKFLSVRSLMAYYLFTDYLAAVDQQAKNMQPMFFLEDGASVEDGHYTGAGGGQEPCVMYFNKVYDCDTCNGADNDGGLNIPSDLDPARDTRYYAGRGSILWVDLRGQSEMQVSATETLLLSSVADTMRGSQTFTPANAKAQFIGLRAAMWPKAVVACDCASKYLTYTNVQDLYAGALHGSRRTSLEEFITVRWRMRDMAYRTGAFMAPEYAQTGRAYSREGAEIRFRAARSAYFAIGNDSGNVRQAMYVEKGEEGVFDDFPHDANILLYLYNADMMEELDMSRLWLASGTDSFTFRNCTLLRKLSVGSADHRDWLPPEGSPVTAPAPDGPMTSLAPEELPFLREVSVAGTDITHVDLSRCPRLRTLDASGAPLESVALAKGAPIDSLELPSTINSISLVSLARLSYPGSLTIGEGAAIRSLVALDCPLIDCSALLKVAVAGDVIESVRLHDVDLLGRPEALETLSRAKTRDLTGRWMLADIVEEDRLEEYRAAFPDMELLQCQYSTASFDERPEVTEPENIYDPTVADCREEGSSYTPGGHFTRYEASSHACRAVFDPDTKKVKVRFLSDMDYTKYADGTEFDPTDAGGAEYNVMKYLPGYWYKGVNDHLGDRRHYCFSTLPTEPVSTCRLNADGTLRRIRKTCSEIVWKPSMALRLYQSSALTLPDGTVLDDSAAVLSDGHNVCRMDVAGMRQVRFPFIISETYGAAFVDAEGRVCGTFRYKALRHSCDDFADGKYLILPVPAEAVGFYFTAPKTAMEEECVAADSREPEAMEPDWVHVENPFLVAVYGGSVLNGKLRSISGLATTVSHFNCPVTNPWQLDREGKNIAPVPAMTAYAARDFLLLAEENGAGFHAISYEQSKDLANIIMALLGTRDPRTAFPIGSRGGANDIRYTTGAYDGMGNMRVSAGVLLGLQNFDSGTVECMSGAACNVASYRALRRAGFGEHAGAVADWVFRIYDEATGEERSVQGINGTGAIVRVRFGRYADILPSLIDTADTIYATHYTDRSYVNKYFVNESGLCKPLMRGSYKAYTYGGVAQLLCVNSYTVPEPSDKSMYGCRLAYTGPIEIVNE